MLLSECLGSRKNRIDQIRLAAALMVVFGHSWHIAQGPGARPPGQDLTIAGLHEYAVFIFFFLSGLLISQSAERNQTRPWRYAWARFRRIFPALWVYALVMPLMLIFAGVWQVGGWREPLEYAVRAGTLISVQFEASGAFEAQPFANAINGSLWSLRHELVVYAILGLGMVSGVYATAWRFWLMIAGIVSYTAAGFHFADTDQGGILFILSEGRWVMVCFVLGVLAHRFARHVPLSWPTAVIIASSAAIMRYANEGELGLAALIVASCYGVLLIAFTLSPKGGLSGDISYGVYIYAWPVQQMVVYCALNATGQTPDPLIVFFYTLPPLLALASLSWFLVEQPFLSVKAPRLPGWMRLPIGPFASHRSEG